MLIDKFFIQIKSSSEEKREDSDTGVAVATVAPKTKNPPLYRVIIFNDDYTPMEFVVYVLQNFFGLDTSPDKHS